MREMLADKGYQDAKVDPVIEPLPGANKTVNLTFKITEGPKVKIQSIDFVGNRAMSDATLKRQLKDNKERPGFTDAFHIWNWIAGALGDGGTYQETKFDDDAEKLQAFYRDHGYVKANIGVPELKVLTDSQDKKTRWIELRIPVNEGQRYRVASFDVAGNTIVKSEFLIPLFKTNPGEYFAEKNIRKGLDKAREGYGAGGYFEFTGFPDYKFRDEPDPAADRAVPEALKGPAGPPIVDVTMRLVEGEQYRINRITFVGNTTTHDDVIRRELRIVEKDVFNTEALKYSVRRLNQLGYFKALEAGKDVAVDKTPGTTNRTATR